MTREMVLTEQPLSRAISLMVMAGSSFQVRPRRGPASFGIVYGNVPDKLIMAQMPKKSKNKMKSL